MSAAAKNVIQKIRIRAEFTMRIAAPGCKTVKGSAEKEGSSEMSEESVLEKLKDGNRKFQVEVYAENAERYQLAATTPQQPHTLIIACADSRVDVETITSSGPGEVFVSRNVGNMVPPYGGVLGGVSAVIEYAVTALKVKHVVVCGHSDCGAMKALLNPAAAEKMPTVKRWLDNGHAALMVAESVGDQDDAQSEKMRRITEENVLMQLVHLTTHPSVAGAIARGELTTSGWVYDIGTGVVRIAEHGERTFVPVSASEAASAGGVESQA
jgi:carbonic anhydrase